MQKLEARRTRIDSKAYCLRSAEVGDCSQFIAGEFAVFENGNPVCVCVRSTVNLEPLRRVLDNVGFNTAPRSNGMMSTSRVFGYQPRVALRRDFCGPSGLKAEDNMAHSVIETFGAVVAEHYKRFNPELFNKHKSTTQARVKNEYHLDGGVFTSGIANKNNPLKYHYDSGNFPGVWSGMIVLKRDIAGGHLCIPELDICAELPDQSIFLFDGQSLLHGVTPIKTLSEKARRYTVVYYSMKGMWNCEPLSEEILRFRRKRTERQNARAKISGLHSKQGST